MNDTSRQLQEQATVLEEIRESDTTKMKVAVCDIDGILRGKYMHRDKFFSAVEGGFGFCHRTNPRPCSGADFERIFTAAL